MIGRKPLLHSILETFGNLAKDGGELLVLGFRVVVHVLATVVTEEIAHVLIL